MKRRTWIAALVVAGAIGWYLFRPERLFVNKEVSEEQVASAGATAASAVLAGQFHSVAHETHGTATISKAGFVELGKLKGNEGLEKYRAVTIWCYRFAVNFATAPLAPAS